MRFETIVPPITLEQHIAFGNALKDSYDLLGDVIAAHKLQSVDPLNLISKRRTEAEKRRIRIVKAAEKEQHQLHNLKYELEQEVFNLIPRSRDPRHLVTFVYMSEERIVPWELNPCANDAFAGWRVEATPKHMREGLPE